jgi:hypothetical protein
MPFNFSAVFGGHSEDQPQQATFIGKVVLWIAIIISLNVMYWLARTFSIPSEPGFSGSLLQQSGGIVSLLVLLVGVALIMFVSAAIGSSLRSDSPVFCTALALGAISWRSGTMQETLFAANGPSIFYALAIETILLFAVLYGSWQLLLMVRGTSGATAVTSQDQEEEDTLDEKLLALFTQAAATMAIMILLCRSDVKTQSLASVFVSSAAGAAIAVQLVKVRDSSWLWIGPLAVAALGYCFAAFHAEGWQAGLLHGPLAALARPLPLDYVSMGPAGAIFGYWLSGAGDLEEELTEGEPAEST